MPAAAIVTLVLTALLVVCLAAYLAWVVLLLHRIIKTLGEVTSGVRAVADRTEPIGEVVADLNTDLAAVAEALEALAAKARRSTSTRIS